MEPLVTRNTPIPTMASKVFHTATDNQTEVRIRVYQGDSRDSMKNYLLGEFILDGLSPALRGEVKIRITFAIDANGIVNVTAEDSDTGNARRLRVEASSNLTAGQIEDLRLDEGALGDLSDMPLPAGDGRSLFEEMAEDEAGKTTLLEPPEEDESPGGLAMELDEELLDLDPATEELDLNEESDSA